MPKLPWTAGPAPSDAGGQAVLLASYLPLAKRSKTATFFGHVIKIRKQLAGSDGLIGYTLDAHVIAGEYWTLSAWRSQAHIDRFVTAEPHTSSMAALAPLLGRTNFTSWTTDSYVAPPTWSEALQRLGDTAN